MQLPEYDNRPPPGTPLYTPPTAEPSGLKFLAWGLIAVGGVVASVSLLIWQLTN